MDATAPSLLSWRRHLPKVSLGAALLTAATVAASCSSSSKSSKSSGPTTAPLTGLVVSSVPQRPALSIKIDNSPPGLPQSGLEKADIVTDALRDAGRPHPLGAPGRRRLAAPARRRHLRLFGRGGR
ncbi:MAG: DUF3048 domain-containing protein [Actinobacteria bacterium]|nr:MAG: DUF3048 domain-containing protein [Actinomycetota bacterium]